MTNVQILLNQNPTELDLYNAVRYLIEDYDRLFKKLNEDIDFKNLLLGEKVDKIYSKVMEQQIEVAQKDSDAEYNILNQNLILETMALTTNNKNIVTNKEIVDYLKTKYIQENEIVSYKDIQNKNFMLNNLISVEELGYLGDKKVLKKDSDKTYFIEELSIENSYKIPNSILNVDGFKEYFYNNRETTSNINIETTEEFEKIIVSNSSFNDVILDYTEEEIKGSGSKMSNFIETQSASEAKKQIVNIELKYANPLKDNIISFNDKNFIYTPSEDDTTDVILSNLKDKIKETEDYVEFNTDYSYYTKTPKSDDGDIPFAWFVKDKEEDKEYDVVIQTDDEGEHDIIVDWEDNTLTFTYANDENGDPIEATVQEILDNVNGYEECPINVELVDDSYSNEDEIGFEMEFSLERNINVLQLILSNKENTLSYSPKNIALISELQSYQEGKHQKGNIDIVSFKRGYDYYIKINDNTINISTKDDDNSSVVDGHSLALKFSELLEEEGSFSSNVNKSSVLMVSKDYNQYTIETSGEQDYNKPIERDVVIKYDLGKYVEQGENTYLFKPFDFLNLTQNSPLTLKELNTLKDTGVILNSDNISECRMVDTNGYPVYYSKEENDVVTLFEATVELKNILLASKEAVAIDTSGDFVSVYDTFVDCNLNFPISAMVKKNALFANYKNQMLPSAQVEIFMEENIKYVEKELLGKTDNEYTNMLKTFSNYIIENNISSMFDIHTKPNKNRKGYFLYKYKNINQVFEPFYGWGDEKILNDSEYRLHPETIETLKLNNPTKHALLDICLGQNAPNLLEQIAFIINNHYFSETDVAIHLGSNLFKDIVLDWDTEEEQDKTNYGLDGSAEQELVTFDKLYIRQYKPSLKKSSSNSMNDYINTSFNEQNETEKMFALGLLNMYHTEKDKIEVDIIPYEPLIVGESIYNDLLYQSILTAGYFPKNADVFINKMTHGYSHKYRDSVWNTLIQTITIKDKNNITGIKDSLSILRLLYDKFEGDKSNFVVFLGYTSSGCQNTGLMNLFFKILEFFIRNNIAEDDFEKTYKSLLGNIFLNDSDTEEYVVPYLFFKYFLGKTGAKNYFGDDAIDVTISKDDFLYEGEEDDEYKLVFKSYPKRTLNSIMGSNKFLFVEHNLKTSE